MKAIKYDNENRPEDPEEQQNAERSQTPSLPTGSEKANFRTLTRKQFRNRLKRRIKYFNQILQL